MILIGGFYSENENCDAKMIIPSSQYVMNVQPYFKGQTLFWLTKKHGCESSPEYQFQTNLLGRCVGVQSVGRSSAWS